MLIGFADLAQLVEQLFRKQQVAGSSPAVGSTARNVDNPGSWSCAVMRRSGGTADALRSGRSGETRGSSNLPFGTTCTRGTRIRIVDTWRREPGKGDRWEPIPEESPSCMSQGAR